MTKDRFTGPLIGKRFRLGPRYASPGQAKTRIALDEQRGVEVVVKEHRLGGSYGSAGRGAEGPLHDPGGWKKFELFEREAQVLAQLAHPGVPRLVARLEEDGAFWLVMERAPGANLRTYAKKVRFAEADLRRILRGTLEILVYLHERMPPVIHRDLKPANLVMDAEGKIMVVDFGGVKAALRDTGGTTVVGTFGYMAPEQLHGEATPATDLYGLGATIAALATGMEPEELPRKGLAIDLAQVMPGTSKELVALLTKMCAPEPAARPASARAVLAELDRIAAGAPVPPSKVKAIVHRRGLMDELGVAPLPLRALMRVLFVTLGASGFAALSVARVAAVPVLFSLLALFARTPRGKGRFARVRKELGDALDEGRGSFRDLLHEGLGRSSGVSGPDGHRTDTRRR